MKFLLLITRPWFAVTLIVGFTLITAVTWTSARSIHTAPTVSQAAQPAGVSTPAAVKSTWSKAILSVTNMSCGGCVENIKACLAPLPGIGTISVDVASGSAEVYFDSNRLTEVQKIADAITGIGYPAKLERLLSANQVRQELTLTTNRAENHIASVGNLEIARKDYNIELNHARNRYEQLYGVETFTKPKGALVLQRIKVQIAQRLIDEGIKFQEVERAGYSVPSAKVEAALAEYIQQREISIDQLQSDMQANDYPFNHFQKKFTQRVRLQSYLDEKILAKSIDTDDRQQRYANWLANARTLAKVVYYDKDLEALVKAGGGGVSCSGSGGGASCSGNGKVCSASR